MEKQSVDLEPYFIYLDELRESGEVNMFGSAVYLMDAYELKRADAVAIVSKWMKTFEERHKEDK